MITITGATGQLGSAIVDFLIQKGQNPSEINVLARTQEKAQSLKDKGVHVTIGNYDDYNSLVAAFAETDKLLFVSSSEIEKRDAQHKNVVNAAKEAGIPYVIYTSFKRQTEGPESTLAFVIATHLATEKALKESGMQYTILRNNLYMDMLPMILGENVLQNGVYYPAKEGRVGYVLRSDLAEATANVLLGENHENKDYNLSNPTEVKFSEVASHLSTISGENINYMSPSLEEYQGALKTAGVPEMFIGMMSTFAVAIAQNELISDNTDLPQLLGRQPISYQDFLTSVYAKN